MPTGKVTYPESSPDDPVGPFSLVPSYLIYSNENAGEQLMIYWPDPGFRINQVAEFDIEELELEYLDSTVGTVKKIKVDTAICAEGPPGSTTM